MRTNCAQTQLPHTAGHTPARPRPRARALPRRAALRVARGCAALALRARALRRVALLRLGAASQASHGSRQPTWDARASRQCP